MKKIILLLAGICFSAQAFAQDIAANKVPSVVINTFKQAFPKASKVEWELKVDLYNADFNIGTTDHEAWLDKKGTIVKQKKDIATKNLPSLVTKSINDNFKGYRIDDVDWYEVDKQVFYKVELQKQKEEKNVVFDKNGKIVNRIL
ncbi:MAG: hypothetical protein EOO87_14830 [Pedobacter sp.]|nr:MAG: hypothetical protein EOO87_14830 [Pedobacter sp.]